MESDLSGPDPLLGRVVAGKFEIQALLGGGGMGKVYRARHRALDKIIAIKVLHQMYQADSKFAQRFQREALSASKLDHPNGMQVLDFGQEPDGLLYIAMELLDGRDLHKILLTEGLPSLERTVDIMSQACAALQAAHDQGIVHRDMKPENIVVVQKVDDDGSVVDQVKVCDFGIAKVQDTRAYDDAPEAAPLTTAGMVCGTPEFMSPEQARGLQLDARSDIYSCGVILYQMATGRLPFTGDSAIGIVMKHIMEAPPPPSTFNPSIAPALEALILRTMSKDPAQRPQTARELRAELRALVSPAGASARFAAGAVADAGVVVRVTGAGVGVAPTVEAPATPPQSRPSSAGAAPQGLATGPTAVAPATPAPASIVTGSTVSAAAAQPATQAAIAAPATVGGIEVAQPATPTTRRGPGALVSGALALVAVAIFGTWYALRGGRQVDAVGPSAAPVTSIEAPPPQPAPEPATPPRAVQEEPAPTAVIEPEPTPPEQAPTQPEPEPDRARSVRPPSRTASAPSPAPTPAPIAPEPAPAPAAVAPPPQPAPAPVVTPAPAPRPQPAPAPAPPPARTGPLAAQASISIIRWNGSSPRSTGSAAANRLRGALERCYAQAAERAGRNARGAVTVSLTIDENGRAASVQTDGEILPGVGSCIRGVMRRLAAARPDTGTVDVTFRVEFTPRGN